jgi:16S rRNA (cytidine1402-2'-O)-methyltransferase
MDAPKNLFAMPEPTSLLAPGLYVLATPLGNLGDITLRALETLKNVRMIACEDTRVTRELLQHLGIAIPQLISVREHNEREQSANVVAKIASGEAVVYASDAGTPGVSDPGSRLVAAVREAGLMVTPIPGVSAVSTAISVAGFETNAFTFLGFAPTTSSALDQFIDGMTASPQVSVFFESPHRIDKTLSRLGELLPADRQVLIARELTKKFETITSISAEALSAWLETKAHQARGEFVIVVDAAREARNPRADLDEITLMKTLLEELPASKAAKVAAKLTGAPRESLYELAETLKQR